MAVSTTVFVSYADEDKDVAQMIRHVLKEWFRDKAWVRDFDLKGGDLIVEAVELAITEANWFIVLLSAASIESSWIRHELNLAMVRSMEDMNLRIAVVKLDNSPYPPHLAYALNSRFTIDLSNIENKEREIYDLIEYIEIQGGSRVVHEVYVDRGDDADRFALLARRNKVIFVLGVAGIGKRSFVSNSVAPKLQKTPLTIDLTRGHSSDYFARQIIQKVHVSSPPIANVPVEQLMQTALLGLRDRSGIAFLALNDLQFALDATNTMFSYLLDFLEQFIAMDIQTHVVITTTRTPEIPPSISGSADVLHLKGLANQYIEECLDLWLQELGGIKKFAVASEIASLQEMISGHPLAAKMLSTAIKGNVYPAEILSSRLRKSFELRLAEYVIRSVVQEKLSALQLSILRIMAFLQEPLLLEDILVLIDQTKYDLEHVHEAIAHLSKQFLIERNGELMRLHNFVRTYFNEQFEQRELIGLRNEYALTFGHYAYDKTIRLSSELENLYRGNKNEQVTINRIASQVLRYAVPAGRLLRVIGEDELAEKIPLQIGGTLRDMVFYFYQTSKEYSRALDYADKWLKLNPNDLEIMLYKARSYKSLGGPENLRKAQDVLDRIEKGSYSRRFAQRILRERALISEDLGDLESAKEFYRQAIGLTTLYPFPEVYVGLATILVHEADDLVGGSTEKMDKAREAVWLLDNARDHSVAFERYHTNIYVEALLQAGDSRGKEELEEALRQRPNDARLNLKKAEMLRQERNYDVATTYAQRAVENGAYAALLTLVNILFAQIQESIDPVKTNELNTELQKYLSMFRASTSIARELSVADSIEARISRLTGDWDKARSITAKHNNSRDPYMIYEICKIHLHEAGVAISEANWESARLALQSVQERISNYPGRLSDALLDVQLEAMALEQEVDNRENLIDDE